MFSSATYILHQYTTNVHKNHTLYLTGYTRKIRTRNSGHLPKHFIIVTIRRLEKISNNRKELFHALELFHISSFSCYMWNYQFCACYTNQKENHINHSCSINSQSYMYFGPPKLLIGDRNSAFTEGIQFILWTIDC